MIYFGPQMTRLNLFRADKQKTTARRNDKVASQIRECFSMALSRGDFPILHRHEKDSKLTVPVTITYIDLSPDLRNAVVFYTPLGGMKKEETKRFFDIQAHYFKSIIAKRMKLKYIPNLVFKLDTSIEYSERIDNLLKDANKTASDSIDNGMQ